MDGHRRLDGECILPRAERRERVLTMAHGSLLQIRLLLARTVDDHHTVLYTYIHTTVLVLSVALALAQRLTRALLPLGATVRE